MRPDLRKLLGKELHSLREEQGFTLQALSFISKKDEKQILNMERDGGNYTISEWNDVLSAMGFRLGIVNIDNCSVPDCLEPLHRKKKVVMIIGNGFDMDLGLRTSYWAFAESTYWPFKDNFIRMPDYSEPIYSKLAEELNKEKKRWCVFEEALRQYGMRIYEEYGNKYPDAKIDEYVLKAFRLALKSYLKSVENNYFANSELIAKSHNTAAAIVIKEMIDVEASIYSFNYTDTEKLVYYSTTPIPTKDDFEKWASENRNIFQVHGTLYSNNIVLGVEEDCMIPDNLFFLKKVAQHDFRETNLLSDLQDADKVVFFGHSLGNIDAYYFQNFFEMLSDQITQTKKEILFYTYDEKSIQQLKLNIEKMTRGKLLQFTNNNYVEFVMTKR